MKINFFKLNNLGSVNIDQDFKIEEEYYKGMDIINIKDTHISGSVRTEFDNIVANLKVTGTFVIPCSISLEPVDCKFNCLIDDTIGSIDEFYKINKNEIDILPFVWSYVVSEVPMKVVKKGINLDDYKGDGWNLTSSD